MATTQNQPQPVTLTDWLTNNTVDKSFLILQNNPYVDGGKVIQQLPPNGLLDILWVNLQLSTVVGGTVSGGTFQGFPTPAPFSFVKTIRFYNNRSYFPIQLSLWGLYKWIRARYGIDPLSSGGTANYSTNNNAAIGNGAPTHAIVPGAAIVAQTYTFNISFPIPIAYNESAEQGLIFLQQNSTFFTVELDFGTTNVASTSGPVSNDLVNALTGTAATVTTTGTISMHMDYFETGTGWQNFATDYMSVSETVGNNPLIAGDNLYKLPTALLYTMLIPEVINNGAAVAVANISTVFLRYAGNNLKYNYPYASLLAKNFTSKNLAPTDGSAVIDMGMRKQLIRHRDLINALAANITNDMEIHMVVSTGLSITAPSQYTVVAEQMNKQVALAPSLGT